MRFFNNETFFPEIVVIVTDSWHYSGPEIGTEFLKSQGGGGRKNNLTPTGIIH